MPEFAGIDKNSLPEHIAIIMDGNGRWAKKRLRPRIFGHREGVKTVDRVTSFCRELGIKALTLYSFSSENWLRPPDEISALMSILKEYLERELARMLKENIRFNTIGNIDALPDYAKSAVLSAMEKTAQNDGMVLTLALSYGSRDEILHATKQIAEKVRSGAIKISEIDEKLFSSSLFTSDLPEPDLLIRTSGELRISNFMLWQMAYTELYFTDKLWPEISKDDMRLAIIDFQKRRRRFGKTDEQIGIKES